MFCFSAETSGKEKEERAGEGVVPALPPASDKPDSKAEGGAGEKDKDASITAPTATPTPAPGQDGKDKEGEAVPGQDTMVIYPEPVSDHDDTENQEGMWKKLFFTKS